MKHKIQLLARQKDNELASREEPGNCLAWHPAWQVKDHF